MYHFYYNVAKITLLFLFLPFQCGKKKQILIYDSVIIFYFQSIFMNLNLVNFVTYSRSNLKDKFYLKRYNKKCDSIT